MGKDRQKRSKTESEAERYADARRYMRDNFSVAKSGDKSEVFRSSFTRLGSFDQYVLSGGSAGETIFNAMWSELNVKRAPHAEHDYFSCTICQAAEKMEKAHRAKVAKLRETLDGLVRVLQTH